MTKLRFTITGTYEAQPNDYETDDPTEMAKIDEANMKVGDISYDEMCEWSDNVQVTIKPVIG